MSKQINQPRVLKAAGIGIAVTQILDIMIHAATDQLEPLRVSSNLVVLLWLAFMASGKLKTHSLRTAVVAILVYLILNVVFLALEGVTNANQGGQLRVMLFLLIFITVTLSSFLIYLYEKHTMN
jgi:uncharacterized membrane protein YozB (DUF420 family)